jgi:metacaspase-1
MNIALTVGINNYPDAPLRGCLNDVANIRGYLTKYYGFSALQVKALRDEQATKANVLCSLQQMTARAQKGDHLVFHYSGHGSQVPAQGAGESDGLDEILVPFDFDWTSNFIRDDDLAGIFRSLDAGATCDVILDCCHSGTGLRDGSDTPRFIPFPLPLASGWRPRPLLKGLDQQSNIVLWAGCKSSQYSADAYIGGKYQGAMTYGFLAALSGADLGMLVHGKSRELIYQRLLKLLSAQGYDQVPQLECSAEMRARNIFT